MDMDEWMKALARGDSTASQQFYDRYGLPVYRYILEKTGDPDRTRVLWKNTFRALTAQLRSSGEPDLPLLWLTALADVQLEQDRSGDDTAQSRRLSQELMGDPEVSNGIASPAPSAAPDVLPGAEPPEPAPPQPEPTAMPRPGTQRRRAALAVLLIGLIMLAAVGVWAGAGFLMAQEVLPAYDLGYSWFNGHVFRLFPPSS